MSAQALAKRTEDDERRLSTLSDGQLSRDGSLLTERLSRRYADRITSVHVKDIAPKGECADEDGWADVGQGTVNWAAAFKALKSSRTLHYIMEHDNPKDVVRFAQRSFDHVKKI